MKEKMDFIHRSGIYIVIQNLRLRIKSLIDPRQAIQNYQAESMLTKIVNTEHFRREFFLLT